MRLPDPRRAGQPGGEPPSTPVTAVVHVAVAVVAFVHSPAAYSSPPRSAIQSSTGLSDFGVFRIEPSGPSLRTTSVRRVVVSGVSRATTEITLTPGRSGASNENSAFFGSAPSRFDL